MSDRKVKAALAKAAEAQQAKPVVKAAPVAETRPAVKAAPVAEPKPVADAAPVVEAPVVTATPKIEVTEITIEGTSEMTKETNKFAADRLQAVLGEANERTKVAVEKSTKLLEEATELTKGNVEAIVASSKIAAKGVEALGNDVADYGRKSFEEASAALKGFAEAKSPTDFFKLQSDYARAAFDGLVAQSAKVSEAVIKLAGEVAEPINNRYTVAAERVKTLAI